MRRRTHTVIKMSLASVLATFMAMVLNVDSPLTSGILAVLSVQLTRTDSFIFAGKRFAAAVLALAMGTGIFLLMGYTVPVFFLFAVLFIALSFLFNIEAGVVPALVLASYLVAPGEYSTGVLLNSFALIAIAITVALVLNLVYPLNTKSVLLRWSGAIDDLVTADLRLVAKSLKEEEAQPDIRKRHTMLKNHLERILDDALEVNKDILFDKDRRPIAYLRMRHSQMRRIDRIHELIDRMEGRHPYASTIGRYVEQLSDDIGYQDKATEQKRRLEKMLGTFREKPLPTTRKAFEVRAALYQVLFEVEALLKDKLSFHDSHGTLGQERR